MIPLSIQIKQALAKLVLPFLFVLTCMIMLIGQAQPALIAAIRFKVIDFLIPAYAIIEKPVDVGSAFMQDIKTVGTIMAENNALKKENDRLKGWYHVAIGLAEENVALKKQLHWVSDPSLSFVTSHVVADGSGIYHKAILVILDKGHNIHIGEVVLNGMGLVGRVTEVGTRSARILLISDPSSRIPVILGRSHVQAIMGGDNTPYPKLIYYSEDNHPIEGEKVVTDNKGDAFPMDIPVGYVHYMDATHPVVVPYTDLDRLKIVRIVDYGLQSVVSPAAPGHVNLFDKRKGKTRSVVNQNLLEHDTP